MPSPSVQPSKFDTDPEAIAWARAKIQRAVDQATKFEKDGDPAVSARWRHAAAFMRIKLLGGEGCVIAAFDERLPEMTRLTNGEVPW